MFSWCSSRICVSLNTLAICACVLIYQSWYVLETSQSEVSLYRPTVSKKSFTVLPSILVSPAEFARSLRLLPDGPEKDQAVAAFWSEFSNLLSENVLKQHIAGAQETTTTFGRKTSFVFSPSEKTDSGMKLVQQEHIQKNMYMISEATGYKRGDIYVDIGGHMGIPILRALQGDTSGNLLIVCVEPMPENYLYIRWNLLANGYFHDHFSDASSPPGEATATPTSLALLKSSDSKGNESGTFASVRNGSTLPRIHVLNRALGPRTGEILKLYYRNKSTTSSGFFKQARGVPHNVSHISIRDLVAGHVRAVGGDRVVLLKLDCEGCEWGAVAAAPEDDFDFLFRTGRPKVIGELHMFTKCQAGYRKVSTWCDDDFAEQTCGKDAEHMADCCSSFQKLCTLSSFKRDCRSLARIFHFNGWRC